MKKPQFREKYLYRQVEKYLIKKGYKTDKVRFGNLICGQVDVVGKKNNELVVIEVKYTEGDRGIKSGILQAHGYSLYAEKCYLAVKFKYGGISNFSDLEREIAKIFNVGLLLIKDKSKVIEILKPLKSFKPNKKFKQDLVKKIRTKEEKHRDTGKKASKVKNEIKRKKKN